MIYSMGPEAEKIFFQFGLADAEANDFQTVIGRFNNYFEPKRNVIIILDYNHLICMLVN